MSSFSEFLKLFNASEGIVSTIREQEATDNLSAVVRSSAKINVRLIEGLELLRQMAQREPRTAIRRSWELLATTMFGATNVLYETLHPNSEAMLMAIKRLENSPEFSTALVSSIKKLRETAWLAFTQSEFAFSPSAQDADQYVLECVAARRELGENVP